jgi:serine/threonine protein kinase
MPGFGTLKHMGIFNKEKSLAFRQLAAEFARNDRYRELKLLGEGGIAEVRSFFDSSLCRIVAGKELKSASIRNPDLVKAFINEARLVSFLDHPGIVSVFDAFLSRSGKPCFTMPQVEGKTLTALIEPAEGEAAALPVSRCQEIFGRLCETLAYAHDKGVVHLDLKPDNIMIGGYGEIYIMDWGCALLSDTRPYLEHLGRFIDRPGELLPAEETAAAVLGTPRYMAPEQFTVPRSGCSAAVDVFAAGVILYEMMTGRHPFAPAAQHDVLKVRSSIENDLPMPLCEINPEIPRRLSQICERMMEKKVGGRYANCREVMDEFNHFRNSCEAFAARTFSAGEIIFREGEAGDYSFIIMSGSVEISKAREGGSAVLAVLGKNEIVGELSIFTGRVRTATARAREPTTVRIMRRQDVQKELDKLSPWVGKMISGLAERFIGLNQKLYPEEE